MKRNTLLASLLMMMMFGILGCGSKKEEFTVDPNDPTSVINSSKNEPVPMNSNGTPLEPGAPAPEPPKK